MHKATILTLCISFIALAGCQTDTLPEIEMADTSLPKSATQPPRQNQSSKTQLSQMILTLSKRATRP